MSKTSVVCISQSITSLKLFSSLPPQPAHSVPVRSRMALTGVKQGDVYAKVINDVCDASRQDFEEGGVELATLDLLKSVSKFHRQPCITLLVPCIIKSSCVKSPAPCLRHILARKDISKHSVWRWVDAGVAACGWKSARAAKGEGASAAGRAGIGGS